MKFHIENFANLRPPCGKSIIVLPQSGHKEAQRRFEPPSAGLLEKQHKVWG